MEGDVIEGCMVEEWLKDRVRKSRESAGRISGLVKVGYIIEKAGFEIGE